VTRFVAKTFEIEAMQFDGSSDCADRIIWWATQLAPSIPVRKRLEYLGWHDRIGHLTLEVKGDEHACVLGDWILFVLNRMGDRGWVIDDQTFQGLYELPLTVKGTHSLEPQPDQH
jgi:hypothetical protein